MPLQVLKMILGVVHYQSGAARKLGKMQSRIRLDVLEYTTTRIECEQLLARHKENSMERRKSFRGPPIGHLRGPSK